MTPDEKRLAKNAKGRDRRANRTKEERSADNAYSCAYQARLRANRTEEERVAYNADKNAKRAAQPEEKRTADLTRRRELDIAQRANRTQQERTADCIYFRAYNRTRRANWTDEERTADLIYHRTWRANRTDEQRAVASTKACAKRKANPQRYTTAHLRRRFGFNDRQLAAIMKTRWDPCPICGAVPTKENANHLDHDSAVKGPLGVRGWKCGPCNQAAGLVKHNLATLIRLAKDLLVHQHDLAAGQVAKILREEAS